MKLPNLMKRVLTTVLAGLLAMPAYGAQPGPTELPNPSGFDLFSKPQDVQLGLQAAQQVNHQMPVLPDSNPVAQYVQQLGKRLVGVMPQPTYPYTFHVVQEKDINAFALPGGPIYVNLGTIQAADNEAQLAGVIAHEMSHVYMRHSTKMASRQVLAQMPLSVLGGMIGGSAIGQLAQLGISFGVGSYFLKYSRGDEAQADAVGAQIMYKAGYNPVAMANFFRKLEQEGGSRGPQFLSDHPNPGNRVAAVSKEIASWPPKQFQQDSPQFQRARQQAMGMKAYSAQEIQAMAKQTGGQSGAMGNVPSSEVNPSGNFKSYQHSAFTISYPDDWSISGDPSSAVTIAPQAGVSQGAIAYGVLVNGFQPEGGGSLDDGTHQLESALRQSNPDLRVIGHDEDMRVNGVPAKSVDLIGSSPVQQNGKPLPERDWLVTMQRPDNTLLYFVFIAPDKDFGHLRPTFEHMLRSVHLK